MKSTDFFQIIIFILSLIILSPLLGVFYARILTGKKTFLTPLLGWIENALYKLVGLNPNQEMNWKEYVKSLLLFNLIGFIFLFILQLTQKGLPLNPQALENLSWHLALNTAISFITNTNWQAYSGESTMSYLTQMLGLTVQNFLSAGTGIAVFIVIVRGLVQRQNSKLGNFWVDLTRSIIYILLPLSVVLAILLSHQGVVQNLLPYSNAITLEGAQQIIPGGPAASQIAIKQLGSNGGGFFGANSAHPFENPTPFSNFLQMLAILLIPAALTFTFGKLIGSMKQGITLFAVMLTIWTAGFGLSLYSEYLSNPNFQESAIMEGKETRFGVVNSVMWSTVTTAASNGSVNAMHSSLSPLTGGITLFNMMLGEIIFGGVGAGMYGMILFIILTVFLSGLMVGRSPEYLGKKIEIFEIKWAMLGILGPCAVILLGAAITVVLPAALTSLAHKGPHGFSEILYAWTSATANNGSAFGGLYANTPYYNIMLGLAMLLGRFIVIIPVFAIAGNLSTKKMVPQSLGTFATDTPIFALLLMGVIVIVGALTFLPALSLGPVVEHFIMMQGKSF